MSRTAALVVACALVLGGCGGSGSGLIPKDRGEELLATLQQAQEAVDANNCGEAKRLADQGRLQARNLPKSVDPDLRRQISSGFKHLRERLEKECGVPTATPTPSSTPSATPTSTPSPTPTATPLPTPVPTVAQPTPTPTAPPDVVEPVPTTGV